MLRSKSLVAAAGLQFVLSLADAVGALPILAAGREGLPPIPGLEGAEGPPFWAGVFFLSMAVASLFGAFGLWQNQKWGKVIAILTRALLGLFVLGDLVATAAAQRLDLAGGWLAYVLASILVIVLVLRRETATAAV